MESTAETRNLLEAGLTRLFQLGLVRPPQVLFSEFVAALVAESLLSAGQAASLERAYHFSHFGIGEMDRGDLEAAVASVHQIADALAVLPQSERSVALRRITSRLRSSEEESSVQQAITDFPADRTEKRSKPSPDARTKSAAEVPSASLLSDRAIPSLTGARPGRWRFSPRRFSVELFALLLVGLFFSGYFVRGGVNRQTATGPNTGRLRPNFGNSPEANQRWLAMLKQHGRWEIEQKRDRIAKLTFELSLAYSPKDADTLNSLAWLLLTTDDASVRDPKRGFELAKAAIAIDRNPIYLDTVAEAEFQAGNKTEAIKLEEEALRRMPYLTSVGTENLHQFLSKQLAKFQEGRTPASLSSAAEKQAAAPAVPAGHPATSKAKSGGR